MGLNNRTMFSNSKLWILLTGIVIVMSVFLSLSTVSVNAAPLSQEVSNDTCLACHSDEELIMTFPRGEELSLFVDAEMFNEALHTQLGLTCATCHEAMVEIPHPEFTAQTLQEAKVAFSAVCQNCHPGIYTDEIDGLHQAVLKSGEENGVICTGCHHPHTYAGEERSEASERSPDEILEAPEACASCHATIYETHNESLHAAASENAEFKDWWQSNDQPSECLLCHTTGYYARTGEYKVPGVSCEACHGVIKGDHPSTKPQDRSDAEYCGVCHIATLSEWRLTTHAIEGVRCVNCHNPHSQKPIAENPDETCMSCHDKEEMTEHPDVLDNLNGIGCVGCHMLPVPHNFLQDNVDYSSFVDGFGCETSMEAFHIDQGALVSDEANATQGQPWPLVHAVTLQEYDLECRDCHDPEKQKLDFSKLGYSPERTEQITWEIDEYPETSSESLDELVSKPDQSNDWLYWLIGIVGLIVLFEFAGARNIARRDDNYE